MVWKQIPEKGTLQALRASSPQGELNSLRAASSFRGAKVIYPCSRVRKERMQRDVPFVYDDLDAIFSLIRVNGRQPMNGLMSERQAPSKFFWRATPFSFKENGVAYRGTSLCTRES